MTAPAFEWRLPHGFISFTRETDSDPDWVAATTQRLAPGSHDADFERALGEVVAEWLAEDEQPAAWVALVGEPEPGALVLVGTGQVGFGPLLDVEEIAARWAADLAREESPPGEAVFVPSRRAPAAIARDVVLEEDVDGRSRYVERGVIMKSFARVGVTGMITFSTPNLVAFTDLMALLKDAVNDFEVEAVSGE